MIGFSLESSFVVVIDDLVVKLEKMANDVYVEENAPLIMASLVFVVVNTVSAMESDVSVMKNIH